MQDRKIYHNPLKKKLKHEAIAMNVALSSKVASNSGHLKEK